MTKSKSTLVNAVAAAACKGGEDEIATLWKDRTLFQNAVDVVLDFFAGYHIESIVAPEPTSIIIGAAVAYALGLNILPVHVGEYVDDVGVKTYFRGSDNVVHEAGVSTLLIRQGQRVGFYCDSLTENGMRETSVLELIENSEIEILAIYCLAVPISAEAKQLFSGIPFQYLTEF